MEKLTQTELQIILAIMANADIKGKDAVGMALLQQKIVRIVENMQTVKDVSQDMPKIATEKKPTENTKPAPIKKDQN